MSAEFFNTLHSKRRLYWHYISDIRRFDIDERMQFIKLLDMHFTLNDSLSFQTYFRAIDLYILEDVILKKKLKHRIYEHENKDWKKLASFTIYSAKNTYNVTFAERVC